MLYTYKFNNNLKWNHEPIFSEFIEYVQMYKADNSVFKPLSGSTFYNINAKMYKNFKISDQLDFACSNSHWYGLSGSKVNELPIAKLIAHIVRCKTAANLYYIEKGVGTWHTDQIEKGAGLSFFVDDVENAYTTVHHEDIKERYNTVATEAWLLDNTKSHQIVNENTKPRKSLHIRIYDDFEVVKQRLIDSKIFE